MGQFNIYTSGDANGPGLLTGQAGTLLTLLDACLVNGYTGHAAPSPAWTKPFANSGNIGCYKQGAGCLFTVLINDNGPNVTSTTREAWGVGWENIAGIGSPVGSGTGQFPLPAQLLTSGHVVIPKSNTADAVGRPWILFADSSTFYFFCITGAATANCYQNFRFGDIYSFRGSSDSYRCMIHGQATENGLNSAGRTIDNTDRLNVANTGAANGVGCYIARPFGGSPGGSSTVGLQVGDLGKAGADGVALLGIIPSPNGPDNSYYLCPLQFVEASSVFIRGRFRGLYHVCHPLANFSDGQIIQGSNDFAGKTFQIVSLSRASGFWAVETSATLETN